MQQKKAKFHYKWILCTKWSLNVNKKTRSFWTPIGTRGGLPFFYNTQKEAERATAEFADLFPDLNNQTISALEVRYVPNKIKLYRRKWFDKYVIQEVILKVEDKSKKQEVLDDPRN